jgi:hypothetical protein
VGRSTGVDPTHREVRLRAQRSIEAGRPPLLRPDHISAGYGSLNICCACNQSIEPKKIEYEVVVSSKLHWLIFHFACYVVWQRECSHCMGRADLGVSRARRNHRHPNPRLRCEIDSPWVMGLVFC